MAQNTKNPVLNKPAKPHKDFPLFPHQTGRWAKKVRQKMYYFGPWSDPDGALAEWLRQKDDLLAGRKPGPANGGLTIQELVNDYLNYKRHLVDTRELSPRTFKDNHKACERIVDAFGKTRLVSDLRGEDFQKLRESMSKHLGALALGIEIQRIRNVFNYVVDSELSDIPVRYGKGFDKPKSEVIEKEQNTKEEKMIEAPDLRKLLTGADGALKTMILLALNAGLGNNDVALVTLKSLDLKKGWVNFPRPKSGKRRRCPLWPETVTALKEYLVVRPTPKSDEDAELVFITRFGARWVRKRDVEVADDADDATKVDAILKGSWIDSVGREFGKLLNEIKLKRLGVNFYTLRHVFRTIADETLDQPAVDFIMGHAPKKNDMSARYRTRISDARLKAVTDYVRKWLFPKAVKTTKRKVAKSKAK